MTKSNLIICDAFIRQCIYGNQRDQRVLVRRKRRRKRG
jgi:hypothetical protein